VRIAKNRDIREQIFFAFAKAGIPILEMRRKVITLEDLFLKATSVVTVDEEEEEAEEDMLPAPEKPENKEEKPKNTDGEDDNYRPLFGKRR